MSIREKHSLKRWGMTGLAGLMALTLAACGKIPQDGTSGNKAGKNLYISSFAPATYTTVDGTATDNKCPPTIFWSGTSTFLSTTGEPGTWVVLKNDSTSGSKPTEPENTNIHIDNIKVEYEVPGATAQIPPYDERQGFVITPGSTFCAGASMLILTAKDFINKNRSGFPANPTSNHYFEVRAKVQAMGYETNGGTRIDTPSATFVLWVYN